MFEFSATGLVKLNAYIKTQKECMIFYTIVKYRGLGHIDQHHVNLTRPVAENSNIYAPSVEPVATYQSLRADYGPSMRKKMPRNIL